MSIVKNTNKKLTGNEWARYKVKDFQGYSSCIVSNANRVKIMLNEGKIKSAKVIK